jgi:hypothetical protein
MIKKKKIYIYIYIESFFRIHDGCSNLIAGHNRTRRMKGVATSTHYYVHSKHKLIFFLFLYYLLKD